MTLNVSEARIANQATVESMFTGGKDGKYQSYFEREVQPLTRKGRRDGQRAVKGKDEESSVFLQA